MRERSGKGERRLEAALAALRKALDETEAPWMVIGGIALIARGVRRLTTDIDAVVRGDLVDISRLLTVLARNAIVPRIEDAAEFAEQNLVLLVRHRPTGVDLDLSFAWTSFELEAIEARALARYGTQSAPMATPEDLVILKAMAAEGR